MLGVQPFAAQKQHILFIHVPCYPSFFVAIELHDVERSADYATLALSHTLAFHLVHAVDVSDVEGHFHGSPAASLLQTSSGGALLADGVKLNILSTGYWRWLRTMCKQSSRSTTTNQAESKSAESKSTELGWLPLPSFPVLTREISASSISMASEFAADQAAKHVRWNAKSIKSVVSFASQHLPVWREYMAVVYNTH